jgi:hypothetical protein
MLVQAIERKFLSVWLVIAACAAPPAFATAPLSYWPSAIWTRTTEGEILYVSANDENLTALCVQVGGNASWLPTRLLTDIRFPKLADAKIIHGMGLDKVEKYLPKWGLWGLSVEVDSEVEIDGKLKEGPRYLFVLDNNKVVYKVTSRWLPVPDKPGVRISDEQWTPIDPKVIQHEPCQPPAHQG